MIIKQKLFFVEHDFYNFLFFGIVFARNLLKNMINKDFLNTEKHSEFDRKFPQLCSDLRLRSRMVEFYCGGISCQIPAIEKYCH